MQTLLINMPSSSIRPPLGISLLKAHLARDGLTSNVYNANMTFAQRIGVRLYHYISEIAPAEALAGDWLFNDRCTSENTNDRYLEHLKSRFPVEVPAEVIEQLRVARAAVPDFLDECLEIALAEDYRVVGFTTSFAQTMASLALAARIKAERSDVIIAFGGANCEDTMGMALHRAFPVIDLVFCGEADISFPAALREISQGNQPIAVKGVVWRTNDGGSECLSLTPDRVSDLDSLPLPDYDDFFRQYRSLMPGSRIAGVPMETSRGCWWGEKHHCTFCGLNGLSMQYRVKSAARAITEVDYLRERYNADDIQMVDNILDMGYTTSFLPELAARAHPPSIFYETKSNLTLDHLALFRSAGIVAIQVGIESLDSRILRLMKKGLTGIRAIEVLKHCRELGIWPHWNILFGFPGEPVQAYEQMTKTVSSLTHLDPPNVCTRLRLDRFSPLFASSLSHMNSQPLIAPSGLVRVRPVLAYEMIYQIPAASLNEVAYYFDFDYADGRIPETYTEGLRTVIQDWQKGATGDLIFNDDGAMVSIVDTRQGGWRVHRLTGVPRDLYLTCRESRSAERAELDLAGRLTGEQITDLFAEWIEDRIMLALDGRFLSLAVERSAISRLRRRRKPTWHEMIRYSADGGAGEDRPSGIFAASR